MQSSQLNSPWLFLSIITRERSLDLYIEEPQLIKWFYGLKKHLRDMSHSYKLISVSKFVLTKTKLKLIHQLQEDNKKSENKYKNLINSITKGNM